MTSIDTVAEAVKIIANTALENERYFCELDEAAGDGDFGYSLARGFEAVLNNWDSLDGSSVASFLRGVATNLAARLGGTSGPIWATGFMRAGAAVKDRAELDAGDVLAMIQAAIAGIEHRGGASAGDKTLLDALWPLQRGIDEAIQRDDSPPAIAIAAATGARQGATYTKQLEAKRGRASYVGERSVGFEDPGAVAVALMTERIAQIWASGPGADATEPTKKETMK